MQARYSLVRSCRNDWSCLGCIGTMVVLLAPVAVVADETAANFVSWRCGQRDGVNCLYLQLRLLGYTGRYEDVVNAVPGDLAQPTLASLAQAARRLRYHLVPVKMTAAEVFDLRFPTIILFEEKGIGNGRFHLLLGCTATLVHLVGGEFITRYQLHMSKDRFRRGWTGYALVPSSPSHWPGRILGIAGGALMVMGIHWLIVSRARKTQRGCKSPPRPTFPFQPEAL
jgi:hypothetical protein